MPDSIVQRKVTKEITEQNLRTQTTSSVEKNTIEWLTGVFCGPNYKVGAE